ncbi:MAG: CHAT domain-containing protein [Caldimonas sp.]
MKSAGWRRTLLGAVLLGSGLAQAASGPEIEAVAARCRQGGADVDAAVRLAGDAVALFGVGGLNVATACRPWFLATAGNPAMPAPARWAALQAYARLSTVDSDAESIGRVVDLRTSLPAADDAAAAGVDVEIGVLLVLAGRSAEARPRLEAVLADPAMTLLPAANTWRARRYLALAYGDTEDPARGRALAVQALAAFQSLAGDDDVETNLSRLHLAALLLDAGELAAVQPLYDEAARRFAARLGPLHPYTLRARRGLSLVALHRGRGAEALSVAETTLREAGAGQPDDDPEVLALSVLLAEIRLEVGDVAAARSLLEHLIPLHARRYGASDDRTLQARDGLSTACWWLGDSRCALVEAEHVLTAYASMTEPVDPRRLGAQAKYAAALLLVGRVDEATRRLEQAIAVALPAHGARNRVVVALLQAQAFAYLHDDRAAQAAVPLQRIVDAYEGSAEDLPFGRLLSERLLAAAWLASGDARRALALIDASIERRRVGLGAAHPLTRAPLVERARAWLQLGEPHRALVDAEAALAAMAADSGSLWHDRFALRISRARALAAIGRGGDALAERRALVQEVEQIRATLDDSPTVRQAYLREWVPEYKQLAVDAAAVGRDDEAFAVAELARSRTLLESITSQRADEAATGDARDRAALVGLSARIGIVDEAIQTAGDEARVALEAERRRVADELAALRARIAAHDPRYAALLQLPRADPAQAGRVLGDGDLFLSYTVHAGQVLIVALDRSGRLTSAARGVPDSLRDLVEGWRTLLLAGQRQPQAQPVWIDGGRVVLGALPPSSAARRASADDVGRLLAALLLDPVRERIDGARRLVIAPDPALALLPFDALPWLGRPLVEHADIAHVQSFGVLSLLAARKSALRGGAPRHALVVGDPDYLLPSTASLAAASAVQVPTQGQAPTPTQEQAHAVRGARGGGGAWLAWPRLPGSRREAQAVAKLFPRADVLLDAAASEASISRLAANGGLKRFDVMHFATHGFVSPRQPLASALVLATPRGGEGDDGYLTAAEMSRYGFASRLIVLSACDTATGDAVEGEGLLGFPYVLLASGNASTMLTLWPIDDAASAVLMPAVLAGVRAGFAPSRALAQAQRAWIRRHGAASARAWAGVLVYGL